MIKVSIFYANREGSKFDLSYYLKSHIPMVQKKLGASLIGGTVDQGLSSVEPGSRPKFVVMVHLLFDSLEAFQNAFVPHVESFMTDMPNYTDILQPVIQISEVKRLKLPLSTTSNT